MFGESKTSKFLVGTFEARIGPMEQAGALSSVHSVGVVDNFSLQLDMQKVELTESFPARIVDTALASSLSSFSLNLKEYSARNVRTLLSSGIAPYTPSVSRMVAKGESTTVIKVKRTGPTEITLNSTANSSEVPVPQGKMSVTPGATHLVWASVVLDTGKYKVNPTAPAVYNKSTSLSSVTSDRPIVGTGYHATSEKDQLIPTTVTGSVPTTGIVALGHQAGSYTTKDNDELTLSIPTAIGKFYEVTIPLYVLQGSVTMVISDNTTWNGHEAITYTPKSTPKGFNDISIKFVAKAVTSKITFGTDQSSDVFYILPKGITAVESPDTAIAIGDVVTIFEDANPANVTVAVVSNKSSNSITIEAPGLNQAIPAGSPYTVYKNEVVSAGEPDPTKQFFSATLVQLDRGTGAPLVFDFWKCSVSSGLNLSVNNSSFSSMDMQVKVLKPSARDYSPIGSLAHLSQVIPRFPTWRYSAMPD